MKAFLSIFLFLLLISQAKGVDEWWNSTWHYRFNITINTTDYQRYNWPVEISVNFTQIFESFGLSREFDVNSTRVIRYNSSGNGVPLGENYSQFEPDDDFNATYNAKGKICWILNGSYPPNTLLYYYIYFDDTYQNKYPPVNESWRKEEPSYPTNITYNWDGEEFWVNTSVVNVSVDTDRYGNTSGIYYVRVGNREIINETPNEKTVEYLRYLNNTSNEWLMFDLRNNLTWQRCYPSNCPVRRTAKQEGNESPWMNADASYDPEGVVYKKYIFHNDGEWFKIFHEYKNIKNYSIPRGTRESCSAQPCPYALSINLSYTELDSASSGTWSAEPSGSYAVDLSVADGQEGTASIINISGPWIDGIVYKARDEFAGIERIIGIMQRVNVSIPKNDSLYQESVLYFYEVAIETRAGALRDNFSSPPTNSSPLYERWEIQMSPDTDYDFYNRNETVKINVSIIDDNNLSASANPVYATLDMGTSNQSDDKTMILYDDGAHDDDAPGDLIYGNNFTFGMDNVTGEWNVTIRIYDNEGYLLNETSTNFTLVRSYRVRIFNLSLIYNDAGIPLVINDSQVYPNLSVYNYRGDTPIENINTSQDDDINCTVNGTQPSDIWENETGGGYYLINFTTNSTPQKLWNLSCSISGPSASNNTGFNFSYFFTETKGTFLDLQLTFLETGTDFHQIDNVTYYNGNFTNLSLYINNSGFGTAFYARINLSVPGGWKPDKPENNCEALPPSQFCNVTLPFPDECFSPSLGETNTSINMSSMENCTILFNLTIPNATVPGPYNITVRANWTNLEDLLWNQWTASNTSSDSARANITSNPIMELSNDSFNFSSVHHNMSRLNTSAFWVNNTGNDWLNSTYFFYDSGPLKEPIFNLTFTPNGSNLSPGQNLSIDAQVEVAKGTLNGTYWGIYLVNATGTTCTSLISVCNRSINLSLYVPANRSWITYDENIKEGGNLQGSTVTVNTSEKNVTFARINLSNEANYNLSINLSISGDDGMVNASIYNLTINITEVKTVLLNYTIPSDRNESAYVSVFFEASDPSCPTCECLHLINGTSSMYINFTLEVRDIEPPNVTYVNVSPYYVEVNYQNLTISANTSDNIKVAKVIANISNETLGGGEEVKLNNITPLGKETEWINYTYVPPPSGVANKTKYNVTIYIWDSWNNTNNSSQNFSWINFTAIEVIDAYRLLQQPENVTFENISYFEGSNFSILIEFYNDDLGATRNTTINITSSSPSILIDLNNSTWGKVNSSENRSIVINITILSNTSYGLYYINSTVNWTNPDYSIGTTFNLTLINITKNPILNVTKNGTFIDVPWENITLNISHGSSSSDQFDVNSTGNYKLETINITCLEGTVCTDFQVTFNNSTLHTIETVQPGEINTTLLNVSIPAGYFYGTYYGNISVNATGSYPICISESLCTKKVNLTIEIPPDRNWTLLSSDNLSGEVLIQTDCYQRDYQGEWNGTMCELLINNTGNSWLNVTIYPKNSTDYRTWVNSTSLLIQPYGAQWINISYNASVSGEYYFTYNVTVEDYNTSDPAIPENRTINTSLIIYTPPLIEVIDVSPSLVEQNESILINVSFQDRSGVEVYWVNVTIEGPNNLTDYLNITSPANPENNTGSYKNITYWEGTYTNTSARGNYSTTNVTYRDEFGKGYNNTTYVRKNFTVKAKLNLSAWTTEQTYYAGDRVTFHILLLDLNDEPLEGATVTINVLNPYDEVKKTIINTTDANGSLPKAYYDLATTARSGQWNWTISVSYPDPLANGSVSSTSAIRSFNVVAANLFTSIQVGGTYLPGETVPIIINVKDRFQKPVPDANVSVYIYNPNFSLNDILSATYQPAIEAYNASFYVSDALYPGTYYAKAVAEKEAEVVNDTGMFEVTDTLRAKLSLTTPQFNNSTLHVSMTFFRETGELVDPDEIRLEFIRVADDSHHFGSPIHEYNSSWDNLTRNKTGYFTYEANIPWDQPIGDYLAKVTAIRKGIKAGDVVAFEVVEKPVEEETLRARLSLTTPQFNNTILHVSMTFFRETGELVDPDEIRLEFIRVADGSHHFGSPIQESNPSWTEFTREKTGVFTYEAPIPSNQPLGNYLANLTAKINGVEAGDVVAFEVVSSHLDLSVWVTNSPITPPDELEITFLVENKGPRGPADAFISYWIDGLSGRSNGGACLIQPYSKNYCYGKLSIYSTDPAGEYRLYAKVEGPGFEPAKAWTTFRIYYPEEKKEEPTPPPAAGPGPAALPPEKIAKLDLIVPSEVNGVRGWVVNTTLEVKNVGEKELRQINISIEGVPWWSLSSYPSTLFRNQSFLVELSFMIPHDAVIKRYDIRVRAKSLEAEDSEILRLWVYGSWIELIPDWMERLKSSEKELRKSILDAQKMGINVTDILPLLDEASALIERAKEYFEMDDFLNASISLEHARNLLDRSEAILAARMAALPVEIPLVPLIIVVAIVSALAVVALAQAVWAGRTARSLSRVARMVMIRPKEVEVREIKIPKEEAPEKPPVEEKVERSRRRTEALLKSLKKQYEEGILSKEKYEEMVKKIRR